MTQDEVQAWLDGYIAAWRSNSAEDVGRLFTEDAIYRTRPWDSEEHSISGRDAIVASWLERPDDPDTWDAEYHPYVVQGNRAVGVGWSRYHATDSAPEAMYHNAFLLEFSDDGVCSSYREFYMLEGS